WNGHQVEPQGGTFLGNAVADVHAVFGFLGAGGGLEDVAGVAGGHADFAVGQVGDLARGVEVGHVAAHAHQQLLGHRQVIGVVAVGIQAQIALGRGQHLVSAVEHGDTAAGQLGGNLRLEHQVLGIQRGVIAVDRLDLVDVAADAVGAPHVGNGVLAARI